MPRPGRAARRPTAASAESDLTIVNPADLAPALRESVCQQCHLQGSFRFAAGGPRAARLPPGPPLAPVPGGLPDEEGGPGQVRGGRPGRADGVEPLLPRQRGRAGLHLVPRPPPPAAAGHEGRVLPRPLPRVPRARRAAPAGGRAAIAGQGEDCVACHMPRPGRHEHPPHGGDRPPHPPRHARLDARRALRSRRDSRRMSR